ncbi:MAG TPA: hypothetical protein VLN61_10265 [Pseudolabrys sp.]|nr:hypothetical protein [Pseudolabrys sp.]
MSQSNVGEELRKAQVEPLLPIEKKLIGWSLGTGIALLVVLGIVNHLFPATL